MCVRLFICRCTFSFLSFLLASSFRRDLMIRSSSAISHLILDMIKDERKCFHFSFLSLFLSHSLSHSKINCAQSIRISSKRHFRYVGLVFAGIEEVYMKSNHCLLDLEKSNHMRHEYPNWRQLKFTLFLLHEILKFRDTRKSFSIKWIVWLAPRNQKYFCEIPLPLLSPIISTIVISATEERVTTKSHLVVLPLPSKVHSECRMMHLSFYGFANDK